MSPEVSASSHARPSRPIRVLAPLVANQIAAGEVVERPASVVKELVENALDAGAARVAVELEQGGIELIRVADDGGGIPAPDLPLALAPHATSKIDAAADLEHIATLGFRGEALASICSVARVSIRSRTSDDPAAALIDAEGADISPVRPAAGPVGTSVTVRNLFFNTPARRKFLRTVPTEQGRCMDTLRDLALAHPAVAFHAVADGRVVLDLPPGQTPRDRALALLGEELAAELLDVSADQFDDARGIALWGLAGRPSIARPTARHQHVFINGRAVRDRTVQHALAEAYRGLVEHGRYPTAVLMLEMSPSGVDVNVHPTKSEVRFRDSSLVHSVVLRAVRDALRRADLTPSLLPPRLTAATPWRDLPGPGAGASTASSPDAPNAPVTSNPRAFADYFKRMAPAPGTRLSYDALREAIHATPAAPPSAAAPAPSVETASGLPRPIPASRVLQVHKSYLVTEDDQGVVIIDQHALHERVMFEYLLARVKGDLGVPTRAPVHGAATAATDTPASGEPSPLIPPGGLESQRLLTPGIVSATPLQVERLPELRPLLARLGIEAEPMGPTSIAIHAFPSFLFERGVDPIDLLTDLLERSESAAFAPGSEEALRQILDMMACKAAVKAGDRMSELELSELVKLRAEVERSSNCPHGRPTSIRLTIRELDKLFGRG